MRKEANPPSGPSYVSPRLRLQEKNGCQVRRGNSLAHCRNATPRRGTKSLARERPWKRAVVLAEAHGRRSPSEGGAVPAELVQDWPGW